MITKRDLAYLIRKFNIDKKRHSNDMIATTLKIEEWNQQGKNHAFLFKKIGLYLTLFATLNIISLNINVLIFYAYNNMYY